jgi:hypothetical protein
MAPAQQTKLRWGELEEDDAEDLDFLLPPRQVIGPDENGIKKVVEYRFNDEGNKVKITTTTRTRKLANARLSKRAIERRSWPKFGDAVHEDVGSRLTMVSTEEILLERPRAPGLSLSLARTHTRVHAFLEVVYFICLIFCALGCVCVDRELVLNMRSFDRRVRGW